MVVPRGGPLQLLGGRPPPAAEGQVLPPPELPGEQEEGRVDGAERLRAPAVPCLPSPSLSLSPSFSAPPPPATSK